MAKGGETRRAVRGSVIMNKVGNLAEDSRNGGTNWKVQENERDAPVLSFRQNS